MSNLNLDKEFNFIVNPIFTLSEDKCLSTLITIANYNLLFDCGWSENFSLKIQKKYEERLKNKKLDAIFLSNNSISYYGALPLIKSFPKNAQTKVFATTPIEKLGGYSMIDVYISNLESDENALNHISLTQETLLETFYNIQDINYLQPIKLRSEQNLEIENINNINNEDDSLTIIPIPSGSSLGGSVWTCSYKLFNFVYASEYSIEQRIISDPFPYKKLKKINFFITDNKYQNEIPVLRKIISDDFDKKIRESFEQKKSIFIPIDNINSMLEMAVKLGKLIDEYKENQNKTERPEYKILICNNCSKEILEGIKSLTEFLGQKSSQQFFSSGDSPLDLEDVICIKTLEEYNIEKAKINMKYIILASFESLNIGLGYSLLPLLLSDKNLIMINIYKEIDLYSTFNTIIKEVKISKNNKLYYKEKKVLERKNPEKKEEENNENNDENKDKIAGNNDKLKTKKSKKVLNMKKVGKKKKTKNIINNSKMVLEKKKLFNTQINDNDYLSFNFTNRIKYTDYGIEFSKSEMKLMKKRNETIFINDEKKEKKLELPQYQIPTKLMIKDITIEIKCEIFFYPLINKIDFMSKKLIIEEINPKDGVILLGYSNELNEWLKSNNIKCYDLTNKIDDKFEEKFKNDIIEFNYTSEDLHNGNKFHIEKCDQNIYSFDSLFLSIKTKRGKLLDISIADRNKYKKLSEADKQKIKVINNENENNKILTKNNLKLINIKHALEKDSDIKLILDEQKLRSLDKTIEIYINEGELVLKGDFSEQYFKIKSKINDCYFSYNKDK